MYCLNELERAHPNRLWLQISAREKHLAWEQAQRHSNTVLRYNAYLNHIVVHTFLNFLREWLSEESTPQPLIYNYEDSLPSIWEVVNGAAIGLGQKRIVLIPSETTYLEELCVPQEWVDIPSFAGDYYLAVQVNLGVDENECWMSIRGFTTHRQLKCIANNQARTYVMPVEHLTENLTVMQVIQDIDVRSPIPQLSTLSEAEAQSLLQLLGNPAIYSPREHNIPFEKWASLIDNNQWRQELYHRRIAKLNENTKLVVNLSNWLQNIFEVGWQSINIINSESQIAFAFRQREVHIRGAAAQRVKLIDLGMQLGNQCVALLLGLSQEEQHKVGIRVQLHPANGENFLPTNIKLTLLSQSGAVLQALESRSQDNFIQLKRFICPKGKSFSIQVAIDDFSITEYFTIEPLDSSQHE